MKACPTALLLLVALSGCGQTAFMPVEVKVPIRAKCDVEMPKKPDYSLSKLSPDASIFDKTKAALSDIEFYKGYIIELEAAIGGCSSS